MAKKSIVLCSSGSFYKHVNEVADELKTMGFNPVVPATADTMRGSGNYDIDAVKSWYKNPDDFNIKAAKMREHFDKISQGDAILVVNDEKNGQKSYIGPNGLMEMGLAFYLHKPIYVLNDINKDAPLYEEVFGMDCLILKGKLEGIKL